VPDRADLIEPHDRMLQPILGCDATFGYCNRWASHA